MTLPDHILTEIHPNDSGEAVFWLPGRGYLQAHELREIADELDLRNEAAVAGMELAETAVKDGMHRYVFKRLADPDPRPGAVVNANGVFCSFCSARLNAKVPPVCPECGEDLT